MKIRTAEQLDNFTTHELAWRKMELYSLHSMMILTGLAPSKKKALMRSVITMTYAHWEGYIKSCGTAYLQFVSMQNLKHNSLAPNFLALAMRPILMSAFQSKKIDDHLRLVNFFYDDMDTKSHIPFTEVIDTQSNLNSSVLRNIITSLGLDYSIYEIKEKLLDERLLKTRNKIAHGEFIELSENDVIEIRNECINLMNQFKTQIDNAVSLQTYRINP